MSYTCPTCKRTSHNPNDEKYRYCGFCHVFEDGGNMKPFAPKTRVTVNLREREVIADAQAHSDGERVEVIVELWDSQGRRLDWTLSRQELSVIARAAQRANEAAEKSPP